MSTIREQNKIFRSEQDCFETLGRVSLGNRAGAMFMKLTLSVTEFNLSSSLKDVGSNFLEWSSNLCLNDNFFKDVNFQFQWNQSNHLDE